MSAPTAELLYLTADQKQFFDENGFIHLKRVFNEDEVARMRDEFHEMVSNPDGRHRSITYSFMDPVDGYEVDPFNPKNCTGMMNQVAINDYWFDHMTDPRIVGAMADCLGGDIDFHNGKIRNKPPGFECTQSWHQDFPYERHSVPELAAAITYIEETAEFAGATEVIPGSHKRGVWPQNEDGVTIPPSEVDESTRIVAAAEPGDVVIIHVLVVHRAGHNHTNVSRHGIINEYKTSRAVDQWGNRLSYANLPLTRGGKLLMPRLTDGFAVS